jgi:hypothetical protein
MRSPSPLCLLLMLVACALPACRPVSFAQNEDQAIAVANQFLRDLAQGEFARAYDYHLADASKKGPGADLASFQAGYQTILAEAGPMQRAIFESFQAVPGRDEIQLFYRVTHVKTGDELYHLVLGRDEERNYKIILVDRGDRLLYPEDMRLHPELKRLRKSGTIDVPLK